MQDDLSTADIEHKTRTTMQSISTQEMNNDVAEHPVANSRHQLLDEDSSDLLEVNMDDANNTDEDTCNGVQEGLESPSEEEDQHNQIPEKPVPEDEWEDYDTECGLGQCRPRWLQKLASKKCYVLVYGLIGTLDMTVGTYFSSTVSTVEKRFKIPSRTTGIISSAWDISSLIFTLVLPYLGNKGHKPRWVSCGSMLFVVCCFMRLLPHLIFGPGQDALQLTEEYGNSYVSTANASLQNLENGAPVCRSEYQEEEDCSIGNLSIVPVIIFFIAAFIPGIGTSVYHTLGISYLDDNVKKDKSPYLLAMTYSLRMVGSTVGYLIGSLALQKYVDTSVHPTITSDDPRWIGAWWYGWGPLCFVGLTLSLALGMFPRHLPRAVQRMKAAGAPIKKDTTTISFSDFKIVMTRLMKNKVLLYNSFSTVCFTFGLIGYWVFMPKYMETQFRQSASMSSLLTGTIGLVCSAVGVMASGLVISKFKPSPRYVAGWNVVSEALEAIGHFSYGFMSCTVDDLHGTLKPDNSWDITADCNRDCDCGPTINYSPVCASDGSNTFYSACHAGCTTVDMINGTKMYGNCSCIGTDGMGWAVDGACPLDCSAQLTLFLVVQCIIRILSASGRAGNTIVQFRCVDQDDKSVSIGFTETLMCALAFIPGPILYGMILDSACIVWGQTCGQPGNCWLYNGRRLGFLLNFTASAFLMCGTLLDIGVWYHAKDLQIYDEEDEKDDTKKKKKSKHKNIRE